MNKKLILLMLALPLIIMLSLYTTASTVSLTVKVPVERVEIHSEEVVYLDLDLGETYDLEYTVYPTNAANKEVVFSTARVEGKPFATLEYDAESGKIIPSTCGMAEVTLTTMDGGFRDSFIVQVDSKSLESVEASVSKEILDIGETATIGVVFTPKNTPNKQLRYEVVAGEEVASVDAQGVISAKSVGTATIRVISRLNEGIYDEVEVQVTNSAAVQFVDKKVVNTMQETAGSIALYIDEKVEYTYQIEVLDAEGNATDSVISYALNATTKKLEYNYLNTTFEGSVTIRLTVMVEGADAYVDTCTLTRIRQIEGNWMGAQSILVTVDETKYVQFAINPSGVEFGYELSYEHDEGYIKVEEDMANKQLAITAEKANANSMESYTIVVLKVWEINNPEHVVELRLTVNVASKQANE
ncbi:MAG: Ig-like domain-containing protein [Clostridia bacterium]|nr:Ig-like domain-containing protein [Clostridia bacterium]